MSATADFIPARTIRVGEQEAMSLLRGEMTHSGSQTEAPEGIDFVIHTNPAADVTVPGDVRTYCTERRCQGMPPVITRPESLRDQTIATLKPGVRAILGNAGCELTFRHISSCPKENVDHLLDWAEVAYEHVKTQLVLAPMDYDLVHDVMMGGRLLEWAAKHRVPLLIFCAYRFLFLEDAFPHVKSVCAQMPMNDWGNPYQYPYQEISQAIQRSGAEVWTGAGLHEGLAAGVLEKAKAFGFSTVFTTREAWIQSKV